MYLLAMQIAMIIHVQGKWIVWKGPYSAIFGIGREVTLIKYDSNVPFKLIFICRLLYLHHLSNRFFLIIKKTVGAWRRRQGWLFTPKLVSVNHRDSAGRWVVSGQKLKVRGQHQGFLGLGGTMRRIFSSSPQSEVCGVASQTAGFGPEITPQGSGRSFGKTLHIFRAGGLFCL